MRKTKIICTLGPASDSREQLTKLVKTGLNVARLNFSHGDHEEQGQRIKTIKEVRQALNTPVAILLDTKGPEIRTRNFEDGIVELQEGQDYILTSEDILGNDKKCSITYDGLAADVVAGNKILIDDGLVGLEVVEVKGQEIHCKVLNSGVVKNKKGVNVPGVSVKLPAITDKDISDIEFGIANDIDFIAASFIRKAEDVVEIRNILEKHDAKDIQIISKIENQEGIDNIDAIIEVSDGIMVARGDLGVEIPSALIPIYQKKIIAKCNFAGKPVITATQMLDSMMRNPRPTRAEITDVANAIYDGTDAIMLSGETAAGKYPAEALGTMVEIAKTTEGSLDYELMLAKRAKNDTANITNAVSLSTVTTADKLNAKFIVSTTSSGFTARMVSKYRPKVPIVAATISKKVARQMMLVWGVQPIIVDHANTTEKLFIYALDACKQEGYVQDGDLVVVTAGMPLGMSGATNLMKIFTIGEVWFKGFGLGTGSLTGNACLVNELDELNTKVKENDIVILREPCDEILEYVDKVSAIIFERSGYISNDLIKIAMERNIPIIGDVDGIFNQVTDGQSINVNAKKGVVFTGQN